MNDAHLVMPMAGLGSRFSKAGFDRPKPLLRLYGQPLFWWAAESVRREMRLASMTFVVLQEHLDAFGIDRQIRDRYPDAELVVLAQPTPGALVTAMAGCRGLPPTGPVVFNDCDHAFGGRRLAEAMDKLESAAGLLCHFPSANPAFSYAEYDAAGRLLRTVEKQVISGMAIAGAYVFRDRDTFLRPAGEYLEDCPYAEPFMSGVYNTMVAAGAEIRGAMLDRHVSFGTPSELAVASDQMDAFHDWPLTESCR